jgi:L-ectoine synthase
VIVRTLADILGTERDVRTEAWHSRRLLLAPDGLGFSLHDTVVRAGTETLIWYQHHLEACYCVEGSGEIEVVGSGEVHAIGPGTVYALDRHEKHWLRGHTDLRLICVFRPPLTGREIHDREGTYPAPGPGAGHPLDD